MTLDRRRRLRCIWSRNPTHNRPIHSQPNRLLRVVFLPLQGARKSRSSLLRQMSTNYNTPPATIPGQQELHRHRNSREKKKTAWGVLTNGPGSRGRLAPRGRGWYRPSEAPPPDKNKFCCFGGTHFWPLSAHTLIKVATKMSWSIRTDIFITSPSPSQPNFKMYSTDNSM